MDHTQKRSQQQVKQRHSAKTVKTTKTIINSAQTHSASSKGSQPSKKQSILQGILLSIVFFFLSSYLITDTWLWGYNGKYANWRRWIPRKQIVLTQKELAQYDGSDPTKKIYLAVKGEVFDVTAGRPYYGKGGGYGFFSGKDASRAYTTGCFQTHLTHDLRGLTANQLADIDGWVKFYRDHSKYFKVGTVILDPIDPSSPIPEDCNKPVAPKPASK
ncbi:hypothetical protein BGZ51_006765 [Haplosporangium sp. Z 767]|nr:hypothetical protein BGZ51_006765 [Haplosporangium sp. Z 767]KAF9179846.1 hypothetical protein BGZ50_006657 [Haplosporangium sp. Z 11]